MKLKLDTKTGREVSEALQQWRANRMEPSFSVQCMLATVLWDVISDAEYYFEPSLPVEAATQSQIILALRKKIHLTEHHNQFFERRESRWCNPNPPLASGIGLEDLSDPATGQHVGDPFAVAVAIEVEKQMKALAPPHGIGGHARRIIEEFLKLHAAPAPHADTAQKIDFHNSGEFDETWFRNCDVHIERMSETAFWIGFDMPGDVQVMLNTGVHKGVWFFNLEEDKVGDHQFASVQRPRSSRPIPVTKPPADTATPIVIDDVVSCPRCTMSLEDEAYGVNFVRRDRFCSNCGRKLDWRVQPPADTREPSEPTDAAYMRGFADGSTGTLNAISTATGKPAEPVRE